ncbi:btaf1 RNA polymerase II, B-TFIID transcription factor-associated, 170kDa [Sparganum proliferum]
MSVLLGNGSASGTDAGGQSAATAEPPPPPTNQSGLPVAAYLLGHLLTEVHFKDRLAMQRFLAGLLLAVWPSSVPPYTCGTPLHMFSAEAQPGELDTVLSKLQARLQLWAHTRLFRLMQDECRRSSGGLRNAAGIFADGSAPKSEGVLNIVQCHSILKVVATKLTSMGTPPGDVRPSAPNQETAGNGQQSPEHPAPDLAGALRRAELSVARCLSLQLFWSSRVELSVASAMVNLGWVLPGRLTLFIRPFMETIRAGDIAAGPPSGPGLDTNNTSSALDLPSTSTSLRLQCLAAWNLARLLWLEYCRETSSSTPTGRNPSKALSKVTQNLTKYILSADPVIGADGRAVAVTESDIVSLTVIHLNLLDAGLTTVQPQSPANSVPAVLNRGRPVTTAVNLPVSSGLPFADPPSSLQNLLRRDGSLLTLIALVRVFVGLTPYGGQRPPQPGAVDVHAVDLLADGLPTLWQLVWQEPMTVLRRLFKPSSSSPTTVAATFSDHPVNGDGPTPHSTATPVSGRPHEQFRLDVQFLQHSLEGSADQRPLTGSEVDCFCQCLCLLLALFGAFRSEGKERAADELATGLLTLSLRLLRLREARPRYAAAHTLAMAVWFWPGRVLNMILLDCLPRLDVDEQNKSRVCCLTEQMAAMESIYHVIEGVTSSTHEVFISNLPVDRPLTPELHGYHHLSDLQRQVDMQAVRPDSRPTDVPAGSPASDGCPSVSAHPTDCVQSSSPLRVLISYVVVILTAMLRRLADPRADVRALASRIFTRLLILLPLEESLPDSPDMHPRLVAARAEGREFVQCLLHPSSIKLLSNKTHVRAELRPYQKEGVNWLLFLQKYGLNGILADDLGLGKTLQTICVLVSHHRSRRKRGGGGGISLVLCPATLCSHWLHEITKFAEPRCGLRPIIYQGTLDQRQQLQSSLSDFNIVITTYDLVRNDLYFFEEAFWEYVILDEGHMIKNSKSKLTCAVKRLRARHRLLLTGTPVQNRVVELWSLFDFLMPGFLGTEASFASRFARPVASSRDPKATPEEQRAGQLALENLHRIVLPFILRRLKEDVLQDLPPKVIQDYICNMTPLQQKLYSSFAHTADGQRALDLADRKWQSVGGTRPNVSGASVAAALSDSAPADVRHHGFQSMKYLLSVCNHPCLVLRASHPLLAWAQERMQSEWAVDSLEAVSLSGKLVALRQLLLDCGFGGLQRLSTFESSSSSSSLNLQEELMSQHRALIFFQTKNMLKLVAAMLNSEFPTVTYVKLDGTVPISERHGTVTRFNQDPSIDILLLTTSIGGLGLNLTGADTVIFVEHDWNPCKDLQAMDRAHRIGQQRMVNVYRLITADSIEERIMSLQVFKLHIARTVVSEENQSITDMDTGRIFDNLVACSPATGVASASFAGGGGGCDPEWGDIEASQYADEFDLATFVSRHVPPPAANDQEGAEAVSVAGED